MFCVCHGAEGKRKKRVKEEGSRHTHTRTWLRTKKKNHQRTKNLCWVEKLLFHGTMSLQPSKTHQQRSSKKILIYSNFSPFSLRWRGLAQAQQIPNHTAHIGAKVIDEKIIWLIEDSPSRLLMNLMGLICLMQNFLSLVGRRWLNSPQRLCVCAA